MLEKPVVNSDQKEFWNDIKGQLWVDMQPRIDEMLRPFGEKTLAALGPKSGEKVLEIGCGTGTMTLTLAERVKPSGEIVAVDISKPMLKLARSRTNSLTPDGPVFVEGDAQVHNFSTGYFDALFSRFGVMFFDDPITAFRNFRDAVRPGGRLAYVCWADRKDNPWIRLPTGASREFLDIPPPPEVDAPGQFAMEREARIKEVLEESGWSNAAIERFDIKHSLGSNVSDAANFISHMGPMSEPFSMTDEETQRKCLEAIKGALKPYEEPKGVYMGFATWIVTASRQ